MAQEFLNGPTSFKDIAYHAAESMGVNITGASIDCTKIETLMFEDVFTGTPTGAFEIDGTNDPRALTDPASADWSDITAQQVVYSGADPAGGAGKKLTRISNLPNYARRRYNQAVSTGSLDTRAIGRRITE